MLNTLSISIKWLHCTLVSICALTVLFKSLSWSQHHEIRAAQVCLLPNDQWPSVLLKIIWKNFYEWGSGVKLVTCNVGIEVDMIVTEQIPPLLCSDQASFDPRSSQHHKIGSFSSLLTIRGVARGGWGLELLSQKPGPLRPPHEITLCTGVYGRLPFWVPVSPPEFPLPPPHFWNSCCAL